MPAKGQDMQFQRPRSIQRPYDTDRLSPVEERPQPDALAQPAPPSYTIARIVGPVLAAIGIGMLANGPVYRRMAEQFFSSYPFVYFSGILALTAGLAILNAHPRWTRDWRSLITAIGWALTCIGMFRLISPQFPGFVAGSFATTGGFFIALGVVLLALGGFITFKGYVA